MTETTRVGGATLLWDAAKIAWGELPRLLLLGAILLLSALPVAAVVVFGASPLLLAPASAPLILAASGATSVIAPLARGERPALPDIVRVDVVLCAFAVSVVTGAVLLFAARGVGVVLGSLLCAVALLVLPLALGYGPARGRRGLAALRAGALIALIRPGAAITVASVGVLAAFGVVASLGVLMLVLPPIWTVFLVLVVRRVVEIVNREELP